MRPMPTNTVLRLGPRDLADFVDLDHVALVDIAEVLQTDSAFKAAGHLADVLFETAQRAEAAFPDNRAVPGQPALGIALNLPVGHHAAGEHDASTAENFPHFRAA